MTLTAKIAGIMESPSGSKSINFASPIDWWSEEGAERFTGLEIHLGRTLVIEEEGDYPVNSIEYLSESEFLYENKTFPPAYATENNK